MLVGKLVFATLSMSAPEVSRLPPFYRSTRPAIQEGEEIVVTGARLRATKVDYRQRGARILYCGPRDARQDADAVTAICGFLESCALGGARSPSALSDCVENKITARDQRRR